MSKIESYILLSSYGIVFTMLVGAFLFYWVKRQCATVDMAGVRGFSIPQFNGVNVRGFGVYDLVGAALVIFYYSFSFFSGCSNAVDDVSVLPKTPMPTPLVLSLNAVLIMFPTMMVFYRLLLISKSFNMWKVDISLERLLVSIVIALSVVYSVSFIYDFSGLMEYVVQLTKSKQTQDVVDYLIHGSPTIRILMGVLVVIIAPLSEELLFRGYMYPILKKYAGMVPSLIFVSVIFGLVHNNVAAFPLLTLFGAILALLYEYSKTLWAPIIVHAIFNGITFFCICVLGINPTP